MTLTEIKTAYVEAMYNAITVADAMEAIHNLNSDDQYWSSSISEFIYEVDHMDTPMTRKELYARFCEVLDDCFCNPYEDVRSASSILKDMPRLW